MVKSSEGALTRDDDRNAANSSDLASRRLRRFSLPRSRFLADPSSPAGSRSAGARWTRTLVDGGDGDSDDDDDGDETGDSDRGEGDDEVAGDGAGRSRKKLYRQPDTRTTERPLLESSYSPLDVSSRSSRTYRNQLRDSIGQETESRRTILIPNTRSRDRSRSSRGTCVIYRSDRSA